MGGQGRVHREGRERELFHSPSGKWSATRSKHRKSVSKNYKHLNPIKEKSSAFCLQTIVQNALVDHFIQSKI